MDLTELCHVVHIETIVPMIFAGATLGITLFPALKATRWDIFLLIITQLIFGLTGVITRFLEDGEWERFLGVAILFYIFLTSAVLAQQISKRLKIAPYFSK